MDHYLSFIRPKHRTRRWPVKLFLHMLSIILHNAHVLWKIDNPNIKISLSTFSESVAIALKENNMRIKYEKYHNRAE